MSRLPTELLHSIFLRAGMPRNMGEHLSSIRGSCLARRPWKPRFSRRRSNTPRAQKNSCGCRGCRRKTVPDEDRSGSDRCLPLVSGGAPAGMSAEADRCGVARNCDVRWLCAGEKDEASAQASRDADGARAEECDSAGDPAVRRKPAGNCDVCLRYGR